MCIIGADAARYSLTIIIGATGYEGSSTAYFCADYRVHADRQTGLIRNIDAKGAVRSYSH